MAVTDLAPSFTLATDGSQAASGATTGFNGVTTGGGTQVGSADFLSGRGDRSIEFDATSTAGALYGLINISTDTISMDIPFKLTAYPTTEDPIIWFGAGSTRQCSIAIVGSDATPGQIRVRSAATSSIATSSVAIDLNKWYFFRVAIARDAAAGTMRVSVHDGLSSTAFYDTGALTSQNTGANPFTAMRVGGRASTGTQVLHGKYGAPRYDPASSALLAMPVAGSALTSSPADSAGITDSAAVVATVAPSPSDAVGATDAVGVQRSAFSGPNEALGLTDSAVSQIAVTPAVADGVGVTDAAAVQRTVELVVSDGVGISDASPVTSRDSVVAVADPIDLTDVGGMDGGRSATTADTVGMTDAVAFTSSRLLTLSDMLALTDSMTALMGAPYGYVLSSQVQVGKMPSFSRNDLVLGAYFPTPGVSVGLLSDPSAFEVIGSNSSTTIGPAYDGTTITNKKFIDNLILNCKNVTFKNCLFRGASSFVRDKIIVSTYDYNSGNVFEDCEFWPAYNDYRQHIIQGHHFTLRRCDIHHGVDGVNGLADSNGRLDIVLEGSYIHDLTFFSPDPTHSSDNATHNDCIQLASGSGLTITGSRLENYYAMDVGNPTAYPRTGGVGNPWPPSPYSGRYRGTSILMLNNDAAGGPADEIVIDKTWMTGGAVGINGLTSGTAAVLCEVKNSHLGLDWRLIDDKGLSYTVPNSYAICAPGAGVSVHDNFLWVPGDPFNSDTANNTRKTTNA